MRHLTSSDWLEQSNILMQRYCQNKLQISCVQWVDKNVHPRLSGILQIDTTRNLIWIDLKSLSCNWTGLRNDDTPARQGTSNINYKLKSTKLS